MRQGHSAAILGPAIAWFVTQPRTQGDATMMHPCHIPTARATVGAVLLILVGACADAPSSLSSASNPRPDVRWTDEREGVETFSIRSRILADGIDASAQQHAISTHAGTVLVVGWQLGNAPRTVSEPVAPVAPVSLRVWDPAVQVAESRRPTRLLIRLPNGQVAAVTREYSAQGVPTRMSVRVGDDEFRWQRTWDARNGRYALRESEVESVHSGRVVARALMMLSSRQVSAVSAPRAGEPPIALLRQYAARFGSITTTLLLPRLAQAQSTAGMVCNASATSLRNAWAVWRTSVVGWSVALGSASLPMIVTATTAMLAASASVDNAEAAYIDCYIAAAKAGVSEGNIASPQLEEAT
jgi:hypothetical protein